MARLPHPGGDEGNWGDILNKYLSVSHGSDGALKTGAVKQSSIGDGTVTESKLVQAVRDKLNAVGNGGVTSVNGDTGVVTLTASDVGAATTAQGGRADTAVQPGSLSAVATSGSYDDLSDAPAVPNELNDLSNVSASGAANGQVLKFNGTNWVPGADLNDGSGTAGDPTMGGDLQGSASAATIRSGVVTEAKLATAVQTKLNAAPDWDDLTSQPSIPTNLNSLTDVDTSGVTNGQVLKYNAGSWEPATDNSGGAGDPTMGGDLSGTASNAQIKTSAVGATELASDAVTNAKVAAGAAIAQSKISNLTNDLAAKAADNAVVHDTGTETVAGVKTFSSSPVIPTPTTDMQAATKKYVDDNAGSGGGYTFNYVHKSASYTMVAGDYVFVDATPSGVDITLPAPQADGFVRVKRMAASGNYVQVHAPSGSYIDASGVGTDTVNSQYQSQDYLSDGTNWYRV